MGVSIYVNWDVTAKNSSTDATGSPGAQYREREGLQGEREIYSSFSVIPEFYPEMLLYIISYLEKDI